MDLPDDILDDLGYIGDCITSCNKVENYLMLSEFENNLFAELPSVVDKKGRRWSLAGFLHNREAEKNKEQEEESEINENVLNKSDDKPSKCSLLSRNALKILNESSV